MQLDNYIYGWFGFMWLLFMMNGVNLRWEVNWDALRVCDGAAVTAADSGTDIVSNTQSCQVLRDAFWSLQ